MRGKKFYLWSTLLILSASIVLAEDENVMFTSNATSDTDPEQEESEEMVFSSPVSETVPEPVGAPNPAKSKSHHHSKQKDHLESVQTHRKPVYESISQPCYRGCRGLGQPDAGYQPWQPRGNRFVPYPQPTYDTRRRGPYQSQDYYADDFYGPREPDYGYRPRGGPGYSQGRYGNYGGYRQAGYGNRFLG